MNSICESLETLPCQINQETQQIQEQQQQLLHAVLSSNKTLLITLIETGCNLDSPNTQGETPLHLAADNSFKKIVKTLLKHGANPNLQNSNGQTPLQNAVFRNDYEMVELLLLNQANPDIPDFFQQKTPLHYAIQREQWKIVGLLKQYLADDSVRDSCGITAKQLATSKRSRSTTSTFGQTFETIRESTKEFLVFHAFLSSIRLQEYFDVLVSNGFDDLDCLIQQMNSPLPITAEVLREIGILKPGHCSRLLMRLHQLKSFENEFPGWDCCSNNQPMTPRNLGLKDWLRALKVEKFYFKFLEAGYDDLDLLFEHMDSKFPITDQVLRDIGVDKVGYRLRILAKLLEQKEANLDVKSGKCCVLF